MKKVIYTLILSASAIFLNSCGEKMSFEDQIKKDVFEKISNGYCESDKISKDAEIKNLKVGEITPIGETGMIDVSLEFDVVNPDGNTEHKKDAMLYLKNGSSKKLAIFCDYDYRK